MKKYLLFFSVIFFFQSALAVELDTLKLDAAKRAACSKNSPCSINSKGHDGIYVVKVNSVTITEDGIVNINHYEYQRFVYDAAGNFLREIDGK